MQVNQKYQSKVYQSFQRVLGEKMGIKSCTISKFGRFNASQTFVLHVQSQSEFNIVSVVKFHVKKWGEKYYVHKVILDKDEKTGCLLQTAEHAFKIKNATLDDVIKHLVAQGAKNVKSHPMYWGFRGFECRVRVAPSLALLTVVQAYTI